MPVRSLLSVLIAVEVLDARGNLKIIIKYTRVHDHTFAHYVASHLHDKVRTLVHYNYITSCIFQNCQTNHAWILKIIPRILYIYDSKNGMPELE